MSTPRQILKAHIDAEHKGMPKSHTTFAQMQTWHKRVHHKYYTGHWHEGSNTGADDRPPGWYTGEGSRPRS